MNKGYGYTRMSVAEMYDKLSIIEIKIFNKTNSIEKDNLIILKLEQQEDINNTIGYDLAKEIYHSLEYTGLYNINFELFNLVDKAKKDEVKASLVDKFVWERYLAKNRLQERFFGEKTKEIKIGYP